MWRFVALLALVVGPTWAADFPNYFGPIAVSGTSGGGGGGGSQTTPGGVTNSVQTNNGTTNSLGGDSSLLYTTGLLNLTGTLSATTLSATTLSLGGVITNGQVLYLSGTVVDGAAGQNYNRLVDRTFFDEAPAGIATLYTPSTTVLISNSLAVTSFTQIGFSPSRTVTAALEVSGTISGSVVLATRGNFGTTSTSGTLNVSGTTPIAIYGGGAGVYHTLGESGVGKLTIKGWNSTSTVDVVDLTGGLSARFYGSGSTSFNGFCVNGGAGCPTALTRDLTFITAGNGAISGSLALGKLTSATTGNILEAVGIISSTGLTVAGPVTGTTANFSGAISVASCTGCGGGGGSTGAITATYITTGTTFTTPAGTTTATRYKVTLTGAGAGGPSNPGPLSASGGGGGGATVIKYFNGLPSGTGLAIIIGTGGTGASVGATSSTITISGTVYTGGGANNNIGSGTGGSTGGNGGVAVNGDLNLNGGDGFPGIGVATGQIGGNGGSSFWGGGGGGAGNSTGNNAHNAASCGAGGGGPVATGTGGNGANGCALIEWVQ